MPDRFSAMVAQPSFNTSCMGLIDAARHAASTIILPFFRSEDLKVSAKSSAHDLVTNADQMAEEYLTQAAKDLFPGAVIIGEEGTAANPELLDGIDDHDLSVIIDPIDGTWNYAHGVGIFGMAVSVVVRGTTVFGLLYDPLCDDSIYAYLGRGAIFMSQTSGPRRIRTKEGSAGFMPLTSFRPEALAGAVDLGHSLSAIRSLNCSVHEYRLLAQGQASWSVAKNALPWDHAAGALIHAESGGITKFLDGEEYYPARNKGPTLSAPNEATWQYLKSGLISLM